MRITTTGFGLALSILIGASAAQAESCFGYRELCEQSCSPDRVYRYYAGSLERCEASCTPRLNQCLRTGWWADLEQRRSGGWERATRF